MLVEQDLLDRKQIGLFGVKKNSEILGTNQGAMDNNFIRRSGSIQGTSRGEWDLKDKELSYKEVMQQNPLQNSQF